MTLLLVRVDQLPGLREQRGRGLLQPQAPPQRAHVGLGLASPVEDAVGDHLEELLVGEIGLAAELQRVEDFPGAHFAALDAVDEIGRRGVAVDQRAVVIEERADRRSRRAIGDAAQLLRQHGIGGGHALRVSEATA